MARKSLGLAASARDLLTPVIQWSDWMISRGPEETRNRVDIRCLVLVCLFHRGRVYCRIRRKSWHWNCLDTAGFFLVRLPPVELNPVVSRLNTKAFYLSRPHRGFDNRKDVTLYPTPLHVLVRFHLADSTHFSIAATRSVNWMHDDTKYCLLAETRTGFSYKSVWLDLNLSLIVAGVFLINPG